MSNSDELIFKEIEEFKLEKLSAKKTTHKNTWKSFERKVASDFNTTRSPLSGMMKTITNSDTLHKKIYVECKLRGSDKDFSFWGDFEKLRKEEKGILALLVDNKKTSEKILLFESKDFFELMQETIHGLDKVKFIELTKLYKSVLSLYRQTLERAGIEDKIPVIAIKKKGARGYLIGIHSDNYTKLQTILNIRQ